MCTARRIIPKENSDNNYFKSWYKIRRNTEKVHGFSYTYSRSVVPLIAVAINRAGDCIGRLDGLSGCCRIRVIAGHCSHSLLMITSLQRFRKQSRIGSTGVRCGWADVKVLPGYFLQYC